MKPSLELLRELSDEHVLRALMDETRLTRAELAARTGISKPTVGESVRRLDAAGIVVDTGVRSTGRGRAGTYYALSEGIGCALAVSIAPAGIAAELVDAHGNVLVADEANSRIRMVTPGGTVSTIAGSGGQSDLDGPGATAQFYYPHGVAVDKKSGIIYVLEPMTNRIRKITVE